MPSAQIPPQPGGVLLPRKAGRERHFYTARDGSCPGNPYEDAAASAEYWRLRGETDTQAMPADGTAQRYAPGSFGALVRDYPSSGTFREKKPSTQAEYRRVMEALAEATAPSPCAYGAPAHPQDSRRAADTPGAANTIVRTLKLLLTFAVEDGLIAANPGRAHEAVQGGRMAHMDRRGMRGLRSSVALSARWSGAPTCSPSSPASAKAICPHDAGAS